MARTSRARLFAATLAAMLAPLASWADAPRILAFGDSLTAGYGLPAGKGLVPQLQAWLDARGIEATVIDAGLSGDTTYGGRVRLPVSIRRHAPDAVIVELGGNDMLMGWSPERAEANLGPMLATATEGGRPALLVGIHAPGRDRDLRRRWAEIWPRLANTHGTLLLQDLYAPLAAIPPEGRGPYLLRDGIHPSAKGVALLVEHLGPEVAKLAAQAAARETAGTD